jgi:quercetin dioxygenase-like cupin family protein
MNDQGDGFSMKNRIANMFTLLEPLHGLLLDRSETAFPSSLRCLNKQPMQLPEGGTHFGFVYDGELNFETSNGSFKLTAGMYFAIPGSVELVATGLVVVITSHNYLGMFHVGGAIEATGRLRYIDGCTDSLLIAPPVKGAACLNFLHFPPGIDQTQHTHPSDRIGIVARGHGYCRTPDKIYELAAGSIFCIPPDALHSFSTSGDSDMTVIAYHPNSDFGPTHEEHPMINGTMINGISASQLGAIHTRATAL